MARRKRPETTVYLGDEVLAKLQGYRNRFPHPPSISAIVREAVIKYVQEMESGDEKLSPKVWHNMTETHVALLREQGVNVSAESIVDAQRASAEGRIEDLLRGDDA